MSQLNGTSFQNLYGTTGVTFPDNTSGEISESDVRTFGQDIKDSFLNISDHLIDEDSFATDSPTRVPSQQSTKAYVDAQVLTLSNVDTGSMIFLSDFYMNETRISSGQFNAGGGLGAVSLGETFGIDTTENCLGVASVGTSSSTAGGSTISGGSTPSINFGNGFTFVLKWRCALETVSDGTDTYTVSVGFHDVLTSGDAVDGAYFRYTHGTNSGKWQAVTRSNSSEKEEDTGVTAVVTTYSIFEIRVNSDGSQVDFYINGTKTNDITTTIPTGSARLTNFLIKIEKTAGSTARKFYADYVQLTASRTTAR
jgi:hypothetical protein